MRVNNKVQVIAPKREKEEGGEAGVGIKMMSSNLDPLRIMNLWNT